jgi:Mn-dependent DtxR family transcriptional regulator
VEAVVEVQHRLVEVLVARVAAVMAKEPEADQMEPLIPEAVVEVVLAVLEQPNMEQTAALALSSLKCLTT